MLKSDWMLAMIGEGLGEANVAMVFLGKWTLTQGTGLVQVNMTSGALSVGPQPSDGSEKFNAYGTAAAFILQAANGSYVVAAGDGYAATKAASDPLNQFSLSDAGSGAIRIVDLGVGGTGPTPYYWNNVSGVLGRVAETPPPPATTLFSQTVVTVGLATILQQGFGTPQPDLTWVNLSGTDFTQAQGGLDLTQVNFTHANMSSTKFDPGTGFDGSSGPHADFSGAILNGCSLGGTDFTKADFTGAQLKQVQADSAIFNEAVMNQAKFTRAENLAHAKFIGAKLQGVDFTGTGNILDTDFTGADLTGAVFTGSSVTGTMTIKGADLTGAALNNPGGKVTIYPKMIVLDALTNFTGAQLQYIDFSGYALGSMIFTQADMTGCNFQGADLSNAELSYATLDGASFTGTVTLNGANLSNASMKGADLTNAQLGALSGLFSVGSATANYAPFLTALKNDDAAGVQKVFAANGHPLQGTVTITASRFSTTTWTVEATAPTPTVYTVIQETVGGVLALDVYTPTTPAVLSNAFMVNVTLTSANLIGINASGASIYGVGGKKPNLNSALLQEAQFDNANLSNADFSSANLSGVSFDYTILTNAVFQNAQLTTAAGGGRATFVGANLQGANFDGATLANVVFTNAALGTANPNNPAVAAGVWLFGLSQAQATLISPELASAAPTNPATKPYHQFTLSLQSLQQLQTPGPVGKGIVNGFATAGITLTSDAVLTIMAESVYWQLTDGQTHYVIFQSYDTAHFQPALGVAAGTQYTPTPQFTLPLSLQGDLNNGPVDAAVIAAFAAAGHPISSSAQINVAQHPTDWQIINGQPDYRVYSLWLDLSAGTTTITVRPAISNVITAFYNASIGLSIRSTVTAIASGGWSVNNDSEDPFNPVKNYIIFSLIPNAANGLDVYGAFMRIARLKSPTVTEYFNIPAAVTKITQAQMQGPGNVCPNGDFATTNQKNKLPYAQWLRARIAPRPPFCVPDPAGMYVCPR
jgi:uncharacterized protein YjbI with pentapeptide repeats